MRYPNSFFDRILSINVLYALKDSRFTFNEFFRVLKPKGKVIVTNSKPDFKFSPILFDHFKRIGNIWGITRKTATLLKTFAILSTTGIGSGLLNTFVINRREKKGKYYSMSKEELITIFKHDNRSYLDNLIIDDAYANQNLLAAATAMEYESITRRVH